MTVRRYRRRADGLLGWIVDVAIVRHGVVSRDRRVVYAARVVADRVERKMRGDLSDRILAGVSAPSDLTLGDLLDRFLEWSKESKASYGHDLFRAATLKRHFGEETPARAIGRARVLAFVGDRRRETTRAKTRISPATVARELALLRRAWNHAIEGGRFAGANPVARLRLPNATTVRSRVLTDEEFAIVLDVLPFPWRPLFFAARYTGLRLGHLAALDWRQVRGGLIRAPEARPAGALYATSKRFGLVPVPDGLFAPLLGDERAPRSGPVWREGARSRDGVFGAVSAARKLAGLDDRWTFHDLRRTYVTQLYRLGVADPVAMAITGHAPPPGLAVHRGYQVVSEDDARAVAAKISALPTYAGHRARAAAVAIRLP